MCNSLYKASFSTISKISVGATTWLPRVQNKSVAKGRGVLNGVTVSRFAWTQNIQLISLELSLELQKTNILVTFHVVAEKRAYTLKANHKPFSITVVRSLPIRSDNEVSIALKFCNLQITSPPISILFRRLLRQAGKIWSVSELTDLSLKRTVLINTFQIKGF